MSENKREITLVPILDTPTDIQSAIRDIRNEPGVRKWMYTEHVISPEEHSRWLEGLAGDNRQSVFVVLEDKVVPLGIVSVNAVDRLHRKTDWAFYLTSTARGGLGSTLEYHFLNFVFDTLGMEKLNCEVIEGNDPVVALHERFLFNREGFRRSNIVKDGKRLGVHFLGLTREDWREGRDQVFESHKGLFDRFDLSIDA